MARLDLLDDRLELSSGGYNATVFGNFADLDTASINVDDPELSSGISLTSFLVTDPGGDVIASIDEVTDLGDFAAAFDQLVAVANANVVQGTDGDDNLSGTFDDDYIITGEATPFGDFVQGSPGDDTIDLSGIDTGYVGIFYGGLDSVRVSIDGGANTGSVQKQLGFLSGLRHGYPDRCREAAFRRLDNWWSRCWRYRWR